MRMCGSWENFVVRQRTFDAYSNKHVETVHYAFFCLVEVLRLSHDLQTFLSVLMHVDLFSGM